MGHRVVHGGGAVTLTHVPQRSAVPIGAPSTATYRIVDLSRIETDADYEVVAAGTVAALDSTSTTLTATAGRRASDPAVIDVADATGIAAGTTYLLRDVLTSEVEAVEVEAVDGLTVRVLRDVTGNFAASSEFLGAEIRATFPATQADDSADFNADRTLFAVDWSYDGRTTREWVRVVRTRAECPVSASELARRVPGLTGRLGSSFAADEFVDAAWLALRVDLDRHGLDADDLLTDESLAAAVCYRAAADVFALHTGDQSEQLAERYEERYKETLVAVTGGTSKPGTVEVLPAGNARRVAERRGVVTRR